MSDAVIRTYCEGDEDEIATALNECFGSFKSFGLSGSKWLETFEYDHGYRKELVFVAEKDGRIVSHVQLVDRRLKVGAGVDLRVAGIANVATLKDHRGSGISTRLLTHALDIARQKGFNSSALFTGARIPAHRIYVRLGFTDVYSALLLFRDWKTPPILGSNEAKEERSERPVEVRESDEKDDRTLLGIYEKNYGGYNGLVVRNWETWKSKFRRRFVYECPFYEEASTRGNILVAERGDDGIIGYAMSCIAKSDGFGHICEVLTLPGRESEAGVPLARRMLSDISSQKPLAIMIYSSENTLNDKLFKKGSTPLTGAGVFMFQTISLKGVMESAFSSVPQTKKTIPQDLGSPRDSITIRIMGGQSATVKVDGGVASVTDGEEGRSTVVFSDHESFASLLFGAKGFTESVNGGKVRLSLRGSEAGSISELFERYFPKKPVMTFPADLW
ncbi:MAG: GNAT family N-acetyltransferase [Promethearchaeati archaeon SRVP18_Atabeyarchaeia-1]